MKRSVIAGFVFMILVTFGFKAKADSWETDFAKASEQAAKSGLYMLLDFSGSDWCGWCMKLEKEVFSQKDFKTWAEKNLVCVLVDFPQQKSQSHEVKAQNEKLAEKYGVSGFPTVIILSPKGDLVARTGYREGGVKKYVAHLSKIIDGHKKRK